MSERRSASMRQKRIVVKRVKAVTKLPTALCATLLAAGTAPAANAGELEVHASEGAWARHAERYDGHGNGIKIHYWLAVSEVEYGARGRS